MKFDFSNSISLLEEARKHKLYTKLVEQLIKDFNYANIDINIKPSQSPLELKKILHETIYLIMMEKYANYLNLLYIIDVSEKMIKKLEGDDIVVLSEQVSFLILKREWGKVWYRNIY